MAEKYFLTGVERFFDEKDIIVSKTDIKGRITYANRTFMNVAGYMEKELLGAPHSIVRHPDMPRCVFKVLWDTIGAGKEIFAYVINRAKNGDHYWVLAHVTPSYGATGEIDSYHSNRRVPNREVIQETIIPVYKMLLEEEGRHAKSKEGMQNAHAMLIGILQQKGVSYDEFIFSLMCA